MDIHGQLDSASEVIESFGKIITAQTEFLFLIYKMAISSGNMEIARVAADAIYAIRIYTSQIRQKQGL